MGKVYKVKDFNFINIAAQIVGFVGITVNVLIYQQKNRASILKMKLVSDVLWAVHYLMIGADTAVAVACLGILREFVFMKRKKLSSLVAFLILGLFSAAVTWKGWLSLLPTMASMLSVVSFYLGIPLVSQIASLPISALMGSYDFISGSVAGICNEILTIISSLFALIFRRQKESSVENR